MRIFGLILYRGRWLAVLLAFAAAVAAARYGSNVDAYLTSNPAQVTGSESAHVQSLLNSRLSGSRVDLVILFQQPELQVTDPSYQNDLLTALAPLSQRSDIATMATYYSTGDPAFISHDGHATFATIGLNNGVDRAQSYAAIRAAVHASLLQMSYGGPVVADQQYGIQVADDLKKAAIITLPLLVLALILLVDGLLAAALPLLVGAITVAGSLATLKLLAMHLPINGFALPIVALFGLLLALAFTTTIIMRFREELSDQDGTVQEALQRTLATAGRTILCAGMAVIISLSGLLLFPVASLWSLGIAAIGAACIATLAALTLLPALLAILGRSMNALSLRRLYGVQRVATRGDQAVGTDAAPAIRMTFPMRIRFLFPIGVLLGFFVLGTRLTPLDAQQLLVLVAIAAGIITACKSLPAAIIASGSAVFFWYLLHNLTAWDSQRISIFTLVELGAAIDFTLLLAYVYQVYAASRRLDVLGALDAAIRMGGRTIGLSIWVGYTLMLALAFVVIPPGWKPFLFVICGALLLATYTALVPLPLTLACSRPGSGQHRGFSGRTAQYGDALPALTAAAQGERLSQTMTRVALPASMLGLALLAVLGIPLLQMRLAQTTPPALSQDQSARVVAARLQADFPQQGMAQSDIIVTMRQGSVFDPANLSRLNLYVLLLRALPHVVQVTSIVSSDSTMALTGYEQLYTNPTDSAVNQPLSRVLAQAEQMSQGNVTTIQVLTDTGNTAVVAQSIVQELRTLKPPDGMVAAIGGSTAAQLDVLAAIRAHSIEALLAVIVAIFLLLVIMTGSLLVSLKAIFLSCLSLIAPLGGLVFVMQQGHGQRLLGFQAPGSLDPTQIIIFVALAFGISLAFVIVPISRIQEQFAWTGDHRQAVASGVQHTAASSTSVALLLAVVTIAALSSQYVLVKLVSLGLTIAVLVQATILSVLLLPALMRWLGKWNWWPRIHALDI